jgi:hypothetical protein
VIIINGAVGNKDIAIDEHLLDVYKQRQDDIIGFNKILFSIEAF